MKKVFICSDETVNSYGFRVLTSGIQTKNFENNPVLFFNHNRGQASWLSAPDNNYNGPIGRWEGIKKEGGNLKAEPVFDLMDPKGKALNDKVENDFIRAASIGFRIIETSVDPEVMLKGQTYPTVTKCELIEISVVDIPANKNSLALYDADGNQIELKEGALEACLSAGLKNPLKEEIKNSSNMKFKLLAAWTFLATALGFEGGKDLDVETTPEKLAELNTKLQKLSELEAQVATAVTAKTTAEALLATANGTIVTLNTEITGLKAKVTELEADPGAASGTTVKKNAAGEVITAGEEKPLSSWELKAAKKKANLGVTDETEA